MEKKKKKAKNQKVVSKTGNNQQLFDIIRSNVVYICVSNFYAMVTYLTVHL